MRKLKMGAFAENDGARRLFERHGFREARHYYGMRIDFEDPPDPPAWPAGIEISTFRPEDARGFHQALGESFEDEWGFHQPPFEEWKRERLDAPDTDTSLWFIARDGEEIAAVARCDPKREGGGWIGALGVRKPGAGEASGSHFCSTRSSSSTVAASPTSDSESTPRTRLGRRASTSVRACA
jgi:hypothetical protein